ncbi:MAG: hypothetical protein ACTMIR_10665 [Cellulomonadaceae bacterium]
MAGSTAKRVTANLRPRDEAHLDEVTARAQLSPNDAIRQALASEAFIQRTLKEGGSILVRNADGEIREVQFVR